MNANSIKIFLAVFLLGIGSAQMTAAQTCATAPIGLVAAYSGDGNALDARSRSHGTIQNSVIYAPGNVGQAFQLGGNGNASNSGDRVIVGNPPNLRLQSFTIEAWVKRSSAAILTNSPVAGFVNGTIFAFGQSGWGIVIDQPTNRLAFTQIGVNQINSNLTIADTNWHHVAVSISGSQAVFYLDGVADTPIGYSSVFTFTTSAAIGARGDSDARNAFFGAVDELAIYNRVLSASEIAAIFNAGTIGKCKPLATYAPENQVLWLAGDGDFRDSSGNGLDATPAAGASSPNLSVSKVGQGFTTNGVPQYATIPDSSALRPQSFTIEGWANPTNSVGTKVFFGKPFGNLSSNSYALFQQNANIGGAVCDNTTCLIITAPISNNVWHHIAFSFDDPGGAATKTARLYLDGVLVASNTTAIVPVFDTRPAIVGADINNGVFSEGWIGGLDEVSLYNRALSADEIQSIANADLGGKYKVQSTVPTGLIAWFAGDGNANDISGNGNNGTLSGGASYTVGKVGRGFQFDASTSGSVSVADAPSLNPTAQISIEGWVYPTLDFIFPNSMAIIANKETNTTVQFEISRRNSNNNCPSGGGIPTGNFAVYINGLSGLPDDCGGWVNGNAQLPLNTWSHVAMTYDGANLRTFVNGVNTRTVAATGAIPTGNGILRLGKRLMNTEAWVGQLDEIALYNRALSPSEIRDQFYAGNGGKYKGAINPTVSDKTKTGEAEVTFGTITTPGAVHLTPISLTSFPALPMGTATGLNFDISTNAIYTNPTVCLNMSSFTPAQFANLRIYHLESGAWQERTNNASVYPNLCSFGLTSLSPFAIAQLAPSVANVSIGGRVTVGKNGLARARVTLTDTSGATRTMQTSAFGYYRFDDVEVGGTYIVSVNHKRYFFAPQVVSVVEELTELDFTTNY